MTTMRAPNFRYRSLLSIPAVAASVLLGIWVAGGVLSNDFRTSMVLTAAWFLLSGAACLLVARRSRALRVVVLGTYVDHGWCGRGLPRPDDAARPRGARARDHRRARRGEPAATAGRESERRAVEAARGRFRSHEHETTGEAAIVRLADGRRFLTLTSFDTSAGPDLRVRLAPDGSFDGGADGAVDLGALKGNRGDQQYAVPAGVETAGRRVVIWCRAFSVAFGSAQLRTA